jgi:hypothetical protein
VGGGGGGGGGGVEAFMRRAGLLRNFLHRASPITLHLWSRSREGCRVPPGLEG